MTHRYAVLVFLAAISFGGCAEEEPTSRRPEPRERSARAPGEREPTIEDWLPPQERSAARRPAAPHGATPPAPPGGGVIRGMVTETMSSGGYTYMHVDSSDGPIWVAATQREVEVGATVQAQGMVMNGFRSNTLDRTFDRLVLASAVEVVAAE